ncbi:MAG: PQQ-binding-like beta-propeller repeat protein [Chloroflexi bacterium]|nr:PQQ-binding-like beta-propeller repeat protein [Chloroflexota bacterium]
MRIGQGRKPPSRRVIGRQLFVGALLACGLGGCSAEARPLATPPQRDDWPLFGYDAANTRYSHLAQINTATVKRLRVAWKRDEGFGQFTWESFPVVIGRRMYLTTSTDEVMALDAARGTLLWKYVPRVNFLFGIGLAGASVPTNRGVSVAGNRVYELTYDCHLLALDASTGKRLWQVRVADPALGYYETTAPTAWEGLVFVGSSGGDSGARGFVAAYDGRSGARLWQRWTVPAPGHGWVPRSGHHGGAAVWMPPTIDPASGILYVATGNPSPDFQGSVRPGSNPYTDGVMALTARTGAMLWFTPLVQHDLWDYDPASPVVIFNLRRGDKTIRAVGEAGKSGYFYGLRAANGRQLLKPFPFVEERHSPPTRAGTLECPGQLGGSQYSPVAYSPRTRAAYISGIEDCTVIKLAGPGASARHEPGSPDLGGAVLAGPRRARGTFTALEVESGRPLWQRAMPAPMIGGATATAGNLVFAGGANGVLYAFDAATGRITWRRSMGASFGSAPIVYRIDGKEYLAVVTGGAAVTLLHHLGPIGHTLVVLTLGGRQG